MTLLQIRPWHSQPCSITSERGGGGGGGEEEQEQEEEEGLFKADAVNEEDPERDRATQVQKTCSAVLRS